MTQLQHQIAHYARVVIKSYCHLPHWNVMNELLEFDDYLRFLDMDEDSIKAAFKEWLHRLAVRKNWLHNGEPIHARIAEHFGISRQVVGNWMDGTSFLSTQMIGNSICPKTGITIAEFWEQMQSIDRELKGITVLSKEESKNLIKRPATAQELMSVLEDMDVTERLLFQQGFFRHLAGLNN